MGNGGGVAISVIGGRGLFADGTAAAPSISFSAQPDTGLWRPQANIVGVTTGGVSALRFGVTGGGGFIQGSTVSAGYIVFNATNGVDIVASAVNQNITLTPSGTGRVVSGVISVNGATVSAPNYVFAVKRATNLNLGVGLQNTDWLSLEAFNDAVTANVKMAIYGSLISMQTTKLLVNTFTDSGALLQIGTNTATSAGGMVFGTDTNFYRAAAGAIAVNYNGLGSGFRFYESGVWKGATGIYDGDLYLDTFTAKSVIIRTNSTTALTLSSTQAATFASSVTASGFINASTVNSLVKATDGTIVTKIQSLSVGDPNVGYVGTESNHTLKIITNNTARLTIDNAGAATFSGSVALGGALKLANAYVAGAVVGTGYVTIQDSTGTTYRVPVLV